MKTDSLFYELFRRWPGVALQLAGLDSARADGYEFHSEEIKLTAFRLDGVLDPHEDSDDPWLFVEVHTALRPSLSAAGCPNLPQPAPAPDPNPDAP